MTLPPHLHDWHSQAIALGWPSADLGGLASILAMRPPGEICVTKVERRTIYLASLETARFEGVDRNGETRVHTHTRADHRVWHRHDPPPEPFIRKANEPDVIPCMPVIDPGFAVTRDVEPLPRYAKAADEIVRSIRIAALRKEQPSTPTAVTPVAKPPKVKARKRGTPLPGQLGFNPRESR